MNFEKLNCSRQGDLGKDFKIKLSDNVSNTARISGILYYFICYVPLTGMTYWDFLFCI